jgi:hypothetical protein
MSGQKTWWDCSEGCRDGDLGEAKPLYKINAQYADSTDNNDQKPLWRACAIGHKEFVKLLLDSGKVDADSKDNSDQTPLWRAACKRTRGGRGASTQFYQGGYGLKVL